MSSRMRTLFVLTYLISILCIVESAFVLQNTTEGPIIGIDGAIQTFLGIPFALPPTGSLRFAPPQPVGPRTSTYDATFVRSACLQSNPPLPISEDCLYLNIYRPAGAKNAAVMIWVHGGQYVQGTGGDYNGTFLVNGSNTIVVTINYRLGAFGFLALPQTLARDGTTGNYGIQDQRTAFNWVIRNIGFFGGNSSKITIAGESAGAFSVCSHLVAPRSQGLFRAAIMESTYQNCEALDLASAISVSETVAAGVGCGVSLTVIQCLQNANASAILQISNAGFMWKPVIDGYEFTKKAFDYFACGSYAKVPVLIGTNDDEAAFLICNKTPLQTNANAQQLRENLDSELGPIVAQQIDTLYNITGYNVGYQAAIDVSSDYLFKCPTKALAALIDATVPVWMYSYNYVARGKCGAAHATEIPFLFPSRLDILGPNYVFDDKEKKLASEMRGYWISFVENLAPMYASQDLAWPSYTEPTETFLNLNVTLSLGDHFRAGYCDFWNTVPQVALL